MNAGPVKRRLMTKTQTQLTVGIDLGDRRHAVCVIDKNGQIILEETLANTRACLEQLSQRYPAATLAMETGTHSPWISRLFEARGHRVYVANARNRWPQAQTSALKKISQRVEIFERRFFGVLRRREGNRGR